MNFDVVAVSREAPTLGRAAYDNTMAALKTLESDGQLDKVRLNGLVMVTFINPDRLGNGK